MYFSHTTGNFSDTPVFLNISYHIAVKYETKFKITLKLSGSIVFLLNLSKRAKAHIAMFLFLFFLLLFQEK